jgi:hypothetical protein
MKPTNKTEKNINQNGAKYMALRPAHYLICYNLGKQYLTGKVNILSAN